MFHDLHLQPLIKQGNLFIKDTDNFLEKLRTVGELPKGTILVITDVVALYPSIPHDEGLKVLRKQHDK